MNKQISVALMIFFIIISLCTCGQAIQIRESGYAGQKADPGMTASRACDDKKRNINRVESAGAAESSTQRKTVNDGAGDAGWDDSSLEEWKRAYLSYLDANEYADTCTYSLIYVNDDDIPELFIDTRVEAGGCQILTFFDHVLDVWQSNRRNVTYIERKNLVLNADGIYGQYFDDVFSIQNGKWVYVEGGMHGDGPDGVQFDENGNYIEFFKWDGEDMTEEEYEACLNAVYPADRSMRPQKYYILDEICSILRTGNVSSAEHKYEFVVEDVTWEEARQLCQEKGGYLATITSQEELERLQEQMISEDKINVTFFVGANDTQEDGSFIGYRWLEPGTEEGYRMLELSNALFGFWQEGEPSYRGWTESGEKVDEGYVVLFYQESDRRCYLRDVPNDILDAAPSCAGRVGYICEYEK